MGIPWGYKQYLFGHIPLPFLHQKICLKRCQECVLTIVRLLHLEGILTGA